VEKIKKTLKNVKKRDLNKKRKSVYYIYGLNCSKLVFCCRSSTDRSFHSRSPAAIEKLLSLIC